jgi:hypothetical protein
LRINRKVRREEKMIEQLCPACGFTVVGEGYEKEEL